MWRKAYTILPTLIGQSSLNFHSDNTKNLILSFRDVQNDQVYVDGSEKVFGKIFDDIGFGEIKQDLFRHLVITRLVYPGSKLKTIDYLERYKGVSLDISKVYRFLDTLQRELKEQVEQITLTIPKQYWVVI